MAEKNRTQRLLIFLLKMTTYCIHRLPNFAKRSIGIFIGILWFDVLRIRRGVAIAGVLKVFPDKSLSEARSLARKSMIHMGYTIVEFCSMPHIDQGYFSKHFSIEGKEYLDEAFQRGNGVLMISAHIGNGDLGTAKLSYAGFKLGLVSKLFKTKWLNDFWFSARAKHGTEFIAPRRSSYEILKTLKRNEMVVFVLDQYTGPPNGIVTEFFGTKTGTAFGPALFAQRSKATVVPAYSFRRKFGEHVIKVMEPLKYQIESEDKEELLRKNTQLFSDAVEEMIRHHPEQWMWIHRRWKQAW